MVHIFNIHRSGSSSPLLRPHQATCTLPTTRRFALSRRLGIASLIVTVLLLVLVLISHNGSAIVDKVIVNPARQPGKNAWWYTKHSQEHSHRHSKDCIDKRFRRHTLKLLDEKPIAALVQHMPFRRYEASAVVSFSNESALIAADNSYDMVHVFTETPFSDNPAENFVVHWPRKHFKISGFEALVRNETSGNFIAIKEVHSRFGRLVAKMRDFRVRGRQIVPGEVCFSEWTFVHRNKGFEGAAILPGRGGESYLLGLCEGNHCKGGKRGRDAGNGVIVVMRRGEDKTGECIYETAGLVEVPPEAHFRDYSAMTVRNGREIAIASQEDSAVFIGEIRPGHRDKEALFNIKTIGVYNFPRDNHCDIVYCNIEGLIFLGEDRILAVSDEMKSKGRQSFRCSAKDQSVHVFQFP